MKKCLLFYILFASLLFAGCEKNDGPVPADIALERLPAPLITKDATTNVAIDVTNLAAFSGRFNVGLYFPSDIPPGKFDIVIRKNGNNNNVRLLQAGISSFPTAITITSAQLATLFGATIAVGDNYDIGADVYTQNGKKFDAFPAIGAGYAAGFQPDHPGFSASVRYSAICQYNPAIYQGNFIVVEDGWGDYAAGAVVPVTQISPTQFSFFYGAAGPLPIIVTVDPLTNATSVAKQVYGTLGYPPGWPYGPISVATVTSTENVVSPCDQSFAVFLNHTVAAGSFGSYIIRMRKQ